MGNAANSYVKFIDELPLILKVILALPGLDGIFYGIYRICKATLLLVFYGYS